MQSLQQYDELIELKTELATVVEALDILHDFIDSVFGAKFQTFCGNLGYPSQGNAARGGSTSPREALRDLRWKHCRSNSRNDLLRRCSSSSSSTSQGQVFPHSAGGNTDETCVPPKPATLPSFVTIERPEMIDVDVKLEIDHAEENDVPDFLDDVDPFFVLGDDGGGGSFSGSNYNFEGEAENKYAPTSQMSSEALTPTSNLNCSKVNDMSGGHNPLRKNLSPGRCIPPPGLIPISADPLHEESSPYVSPPLKNDNRSSSSGSSDTDWQPSSLSKKAKSDGKKKRKSINKRPVKRDSFETKSNLGGAFTPPKPPPIQLNRSGKFPSQKDKANEVNNEEGPFKCNMCPASYKQEDSLRSHQKYKHNPSRVQCTCHLCGKSMVDKYRLQRHLRLHTGERPFVCQVANCGQSFYRKDYHTKHLQRKHGIGISVSSGSGESHCVPSTSPSVKTPKRIPGTSKSSSITSTTTISSSLSNHNHPQSEICQETSPTTPPTPVVVPHEHSGFMNYFNSNTPSTSSSSLSASLVTMTSLTFDDLISADM